MPRSCRRALSIAAAVLAVLAVCAGPASAGPLVTPSDSCPAEDTAQPFLPWMDFAQYRLVPGGTFEDGAGSWSLTGSATTAGGNEPYNVHGAGETTALALANGSSATSAQTCVGIDSPTLRFFAKRTDGPAFGSLRVDVLFEDAAGVGHALPIGSVGSLSGKWSPTQPIAIAANVLTLVPGEHTGVAFRFTPQNGTSWTIDDVYIDPFFR